MSDKPLFIPLKTEYYEAFLDGSKTTEYRKFGPRWNFETCKAGRRVTISKGYGKSHRRHGTITHFCRSGLLPKAWSEVYGDHPGPVACITIELDKKS